MAIALGSVSGMKVGLDQSWAYKNVASVKSSMDNCFSTYPKYKNYKNWDAAIRAYNTQACDSSANVDYVEEINNLYSVLNNQFIIASGFVDLDCSIYEDNLRECDNHPSCFVQENPFWMFWDNYDCVNS